MKKSKRTLDAIIRGMIILIPLIMIGSFVTIFRDFPVASYQRFIHTFMGGSFVTLTDNIIEITLGSFSLYLAMIIGYGYAKEYAESLPHAYISMIMTTVVFLILNVDFHDGMTLDTKNWGIEHSMITVVISMITVKLFQKIYSIPMLRMERSLYGIKATLRDSYGYILSGTAIMAFASFVNTGIQYHFHVSNAYQAFVNIPVLMFRHIPAGFGFSIMYLTFVSLLSLTGVRGQSCMIAACTSIFAEAQGFHSESFFHTFIFLGGSGATLSLAIGILLYSKQRSVRNVNFISLIASFFNINDMLLFGVPIVGNGIFIIPFCVVPIVNFLITYAAVDSGIVPIITHQTPQFLPVIWSGYAATGSYMAGVLQIVNIAIGVAIYRPFIKKNDERINSEIKNGIVDLQKELQEYERIGKPSDFLQRKDAVGDIAKMLRNDFEYALKHEEFKLVYQPQVRADGECIGAEALLRWNHKVAGFVYPPLIIAIARESGKLAELERFIFNRACRDLKYIQKSTLPYAKISVNITGESLFNEDLEQMIEQAVEKYNVDRSKLWIEITEQEAIAMTPEITERLFRLKRKGHKLLIDDFGMGHTSLTYLQSNQFDVVKLDGSITRDVLENDRNCQIISSIAYLAKSLGFSMIAEYVETQQQRDKLEELNCEVFQGYLYSAPVDIYSLEQWAHMHQVGLQKKQNTL